MRKLVLSVGAIARGDPPQAALGVVLADPQGRTLAQFGKALGKATKEVAEYKALLEGLALANQYQPQELVVFVDSQRMANQIQGVLFPREPALQHLNHKVQEEFQRFARWRVSYVDEDTCRLARRLAEQALIQERRMEREKACLRQEILSLLDSLSVEELRHVLNFLRSLQASES